MSRPAALPAACSTDARSGPSPMTTSGISRRARSATSTSACAPLFFASFPTNTAYRLGHRSRRRIGIGADAWHVDTVGNRLDPRARSSGSALAQARRHVTADRDDDVGVCEARCLRRRLRAHVGNHRQRGRPAAPVRGRRHRVIADS